MIGKHYQRRGYGRQTVKKIIGLHKVQNKYEVLIADYVEGNEVMADLLRSLGFRNHSFNKEYNEYILHYEL